MMTMIKRQGKCPKCGIKVFRIGKGKDASKVCGKTRAAEFPVQGSYYLLVWNGLTSGVVSFTIDAEIGLTQTYHKGRKRARAGYEK